MTNVRRAVLLRPLLLLCALRSHAVGTAEVCNIGDVVEIQECRPLSALKRFNLYRVVKSQPQLSAPLNPPKNYAPFLLNGVGAQPGTATSSGASIPLAPSPSATATAAAAASASASDSSSPLSIGLDGGATAEPYIRDNAATKQSRIEAAKAARRTEHKQKSGAGAKSSGLNAKQLQTARMRSKEDTHQQASAKQMAAYQSEQSRLQKEAASAERTAAASEAAVQAPTSRRGRPA